LFRAPLQWIQELKGASVLRWQAPVSISLSMAAIMAMTSSRSPTIEDNPSRKYLSAMVSKSDTVAGVGIADGCLGPKAYLSRRLMTMIKNIYHSPRSLG